MQDPKTRPSSFDAPMGHTLSPVDATLHRSTAAQPQAPWVLHSLCGESMQRQPGAGCPWRLIRGWTGWRPQF